MSYPQPPSYPQPGPAGPQGGGGKVRLRGRTPLRLSIIFFVVAVALFVVGGIVVATKSLSKVNDFKRVDVAATTGSINFAKAGSYVAYYEAGDVSSSIKKVPVVLVRLTGPSGKPMVLDTFYGGRKIKAATGQADIKQLTYDYKGHHGVALYQFKISEKGTYKVELQPVGDLRPASDADIAFGQSIAGGTIAGGLLIVGGVLFLIAAIVLLVVGLVKRGRHKKELRSGYGGYGYGGGPGGPPPGQPWPQGGQGGYPQGGQGGYPQGGQGGYPQGQGGYPQGGQGGDYPQGEPGGGPPQPS